MVGGEGGGMGEGGGEGGNSCRKTQNDQGPVPRFRVTRNKMYSRQLKANNSQWTSECR
jgi:hypothetical protein